MVSDNAKEATTPHQAFIDVKIDELMFMGLPGPTVITLCSITLINPRLDFALVK